MNDTSPHVTYKTYVKVGLPASSIDDFIDEWHHSDSEKPLIDYLGLTLEEYRLFLKDSSKFFGEIEGRAD